MNLAALITVLFGLTPQVVRVLLLDVVLMAISNILIFSIWYWIIDPPGVEEIRRGTHPGISFSPSEQANCLTMKHGCPVSQITFSWPSRQALPLARQTHCL